jgi:two-component system phosphate regulon sensor histidine kinase PhoR
LASITETNMEGAISEIILDAQKELEALRKEVNKYKVIFDSASLLVGHELIKPLTSISGYFELLEESVGETIGDKERRYCSKVREGVEQMENLIEAFVQMLRFDSRVEQVYDLENVNIYSLVETIRERLGEDAAMVENRVDADFPLLLLRRRGLEVVLENLLTNAIKHGCGSDRVSINASILKDRRGGSRARLLMVNVEDHGRGIPEDEIEHIFNPFYRVGGRSDAPGLGLGLALVKSIITIMEGEINVRSKLGEGTIFTLIIPVPDKSRASLGRLG